MKYTNLTATPSSVYSSTAVAVSADKTGLTCGTTYHFRTQAVNSTGTSYGYNQSFNTAACPTYTATATVGTGGTVNPDTITVNYGTTASFTVTPNNGYSTNTAVTGTCPQGIWTGNVWKTGAIIANCTVNFSFIAQQANAWLNPPSSTVIRNQPFTLDVIVKSDSVKVGSYSFIATLDTAKLGLDTTYQNASNSCTKGVCPGTNALNSRVVFVNTAVDTVTLIGSDDAGVGPSNDLQLLVLHFKTKLVTGATPVTLTTTMLETTEGGNIGTTARGATVNVSYGLCGDSDGNLAVNIIDALAIARKLVNLPAPPTVDTTLADTNKNGRLDIKAIYIKENTSV